MLEVGSALCGITIIQRAGSGGYGEVYFGHSASDGRIYAIKVESVDSKKQALANEAIILRSLNSPYFPRVYKCSKTKDFKFISMEALGVSVSKILRESRTICYETMYVIASEALKVIRQLHTFGIVHNDIKPSNFVLRPRSNAPLCLLDFGGAYYYMDPETKKRYQMSENKRNSRTLLYASPNSHKKKMLGPRDDLYSWFIMLLEMFGGKIPWGYEEDKNKILAMKLEVKAKELCSKMPHTFNKIYDLIISYEYEDEINYDLIQNLLDNAKLGFRFVNKKKVRKKLMNQFDKEMYFVPFDTIQAP